MMALQKFESVKINLRRNLPKIVQVQLKFYLEVDYLGLRARRSIHNFISFLLRAFYFTCRNISFMEVSSLPKCLFDILFNTPLREFQFKKLKPEFQRELLFTIVIKVNSKIRLDFILLKVY